MKRLGKDLDTVASRAEVGVARADELESELRRKISEVKSESADLTASTRRNVAEEIGEARDAMRREVLAAAASSSDVAARLAARLRSVMAVLARLDRDTYARAQPTWKNAPALRHDTTTPQRDFLDEPTNRPTHPLTDSPTQRDRGGGGGG